MLRATAKGFEDEEIERSLNEFDLGLIFSPRTHDADNLHSWDIERLHPALGVLHFGFFGPGGVGARWVRRCRVLYLSVFCMENVMVRRRSASERWRRQSWAT